MPTFLDKFPKILYDIDGKRKTNYTVITNIFFRLGVIKDVMNNITAYYEHLIADGDTPEILAQKVYGDPEAHWIIILANNIVDPQYDWPLNSDQFHKYIIKKYGSLSYAKTQIHHYEKVITREDASTRETYSTRFIVNYEEIHENDLDVPYDTYDTLPEDQEVNTINMGNGKTIIDIIKRNAVTFYDHEEELNENKRAIKIIKKEYYPQIIREFESLVTPIPPAYIRRLV
jgi:hypothetical protein